MMCKTLILHCTSLAAEVYPQNIMLHSSLFFDAKQNKNAIHEQDKIIGTRKRMIFAPSVSIR